MRKWILLFVVFLCAMSTARDLRREIPLHVGWRFEIGDSTNYYKSDFDDSDWERIRVPGTWENQGFPGYNGYAWYRIHLKIPGNLKKKSLYLKLGYIDDVDEVYVNGAYLNGSGAFPPEYQTAVNHQRVYHLPHELLHFGEENIIAVRVYDDYLEGGIKNGDVGIYSHPKIPMEIELSGDWRFSPGDAPDWANPEYNDFAWEIMQVPNNWENQDYPYHDGYGWYRKQFILSDTLKSTHLILVLGLIDDVDEAYFNNTRIGRTGVFPGERQGFYYGNTWQADRYYMIPPHLIQWNKSNTIAVRVYDYQGLGGIYDGPIGITTKETYMKYRRHKKSFDNWLKQFFNDINIEL